MQNVKQQRGGVEVARGEGSSASGANYEAQKSGKTKKHKQTKKQNTQQKKWQNKTKTPSYYPQILQTNQPIRRLIIEFYPLYKLQNIDIRGQPPVSMDANE